MELSGQVALVTGGGQRIGAALTLALASAGVNVAIHYQTAQTEAATLCQQLQAMGRRSMILPTDLADPEAVAVLLGLVRQELGPVTILINNAAIFQAGGLADTSQENWTRHLAINLTAPWLLMQAFSRQPEWTTTWRDSTKPRGQIINMLDQRILHPRPGHAAYTAAKSALWTLTCLAAAELAPTIRVNGLALGPILPASGEGGALFSQVVAATPLARAGRVEEVAQAMLFLLQHDFVTGQLLCVDGGEHLR